MYNVYQMSRPPIAFSSKDPLCRGAPELWYRLTNSDFIFRILFS